MDFKVTKILSQVFKRWFDGRGASLDRNAIVKNIYLEVEITSGYFFALTIANLIALSGLIVNSLPVIIGAMLISPLMGPILSFGSAFITGDRVIWRKSVRKLVISIVLTIFVAALATSLSPLKNITGEILSRTRPNLYDLIIAFLSGTVGAAAMCTRKNYLTIVPGVAIATAVIPPLSTAGFGLGILDFRILLGGFFLFFTNFVAIIISTSIVFFFYGLKPTVTTETDRSQLKKRLSLLAAVLFLISIPLIYTLQQSISEVTLRNRVQDVLKQAFNKKHRSRLSDFSYSEEKGGQLDISAVIDTTSFFFEPEINAIENKLRTDLKRKIQLHVEQIPVKEGNLAEPARVKPSLTRPFVPQIAPQQQPSKVVSEAKEGILSVVRKSVTLAEKIMSPSRVADFSVAIDDQKPGITISLRITRDIPLSDGENLWLKRMFEDAIGLPVTLEAKTIPFVPVLVFRKGETSVSSGAITSLAAVKEAYERDNHITITIRAYPDPFAPHHKRVGLAEERARAVSNVLVKEYGIPQSVIVITIEKHKRVKEAMAKVIVGFPRSK